MIKKTLVLLAATGLTLAVPAARSFAEDKAPKLETVATFNDAMPTGVTVARDGRIFINYPRWGQNKSSPKSYAKGERNENLRSVP